jgi:hypothetical protein
VVHNELFNQSFLRFELQADSLLKRSRKIRRIGIGQRIAGGEM